MKETTKEGKPQKSRYVKFLCLIFEQIKKNPKKGLQDLSLKAEMSSQGVFAATSLGIIKNHGTRTQPDYEWLVSEPSQFIDNRETEKMAERIITFLEEKAKEYAERKSKEEENESRMNKAWSKKEDEDLERCIKNNVKDKDTAKIIGRTITAIKSRKTMIRKKIQKETKPKKEESVSIKEITQEKPKSTEIPFSTEIPLSKEKTIPEFELAMDAKEKEKWQSLDSIIQANTDALLIEVRRIADALAYFVKVEKAKPIEPWSKRRLFTILHKPKEECDGAELHIQDLWRNSQYKRLFAITGLDFSNF